MTRNDQAQRDDVQAPVETEHGDAVVPDAEDAATAEDLVPEEPPADGPATGDPDKAPSVRPPVPAHGEMASMEQLREGAEAAERAASEARSS